MYYKKAIITGITGQDGSYLTEFLLSKGYEVHGLLRRASTFNTRRIDHIYNDEHNGGRLFLHHGDMTDMVSLVDLIYSVHPDEVYHLAAQSHVRVSFEIPEYTSEVTGVGSMRLLEAIRKSGIKTRFYQASSSEMFGNAQAPQNEDSAFQPQSPYAISKVFSYWMTRNYRDGYGMFASNGILFNHESPRRGETFVTRKITRGLSAIKAGKQQYLFLGNLDAKRDWGYAPDYVEAMWKIMQLDQANDFVIGTGESHSVSEFLNEAFSYVDLDWHDYVRIDPYYFRPTEVHELRADTAKAKRILDWSPFVSFKELVQIMVDADFELVGLVCKGEGKKILEARDGCWHQWGSQIVSMELMSSSNPPTASANGEQHR
jgi:GDPmannose 4,6-dehydratase